MGFFRKKEKIDTPVIHKQWKITRKCLQLIIECAKSSYPKEFSGLLRIGTTAKDTIVEIVLLPGTISGDAHAIFQFHMLPIDFSIVGTVHSHPSPFPLASEADRMLFEKYGRIHMIVAYPFSESSWKAYDFTGTEIDMMII